MCHDQGVQLRQNSTDAENALWYFLRAKRLCVLKFRRQRPILNKQGGRCRIDCPDMYGKNTLSLTPPLICTSFWERGKIQVTFKLSGSPTGS
ncbi:MAG: DUF559 domain-containing protein [Deltaproteobacteria bacterium]|nr:DUF559 domain-containing protein [Deltaproteobacteria bacterium]